jgi:chromosome segregation protein
VLPEKVADFFDKESPKKEQIRVVSGAAFAMKLTRVRLAGFKSFVDPSEILIQPGLTGIVGPNGCGKSNLVEALRWVMGESSYKALRAAEMDDVIFAGSGNRPARNMAEVGVWVDNSDHTAPAPFTEIDELEITRRIAREKGSIYRVNGSEVRARDVQLVFADASTGARSPSMVRQGQIAEIISARPESRRRVLEEAAGISGLHSRRHEAEQRLKTAEQNLIRVEDVLGRLRVQLEALKRQARQAVRYRQISADIRRLESAVLRRAVDDAQQELAVALKAVHEAERNAADRLSVQGEAARQEAIANHDIPKLRETAAGAMAALERLKRAGDDLTREETQTRERLAELGRRLTQLDADMSRESTLNTDADETLTRLHDEFEQLGIDLEQMASREAAAAARLIEVTTQLAQVESHLNAATARLADRNARRDALMRARMDAQARMRRLLAERDKLAAELTALGNAPEMQALDDVMSARDTARHNLGNAEQQVVLAEHALNEGRELERAARPALNAAENNVRSLEVEARTLSKMLDVGAPRLWPPLIDAVKVASGYETAFGAVLGDDAQASSNTSAPVYWAGSDPALDDPALPAGCEPLIHFVTAPSSVARRLAQIGVVAREDGLSLCRLLRPGQRLVSREGDVWRWDGFTASANAPSSAARRLAERNRLAAIDAQLILARQAHATQSVQMKALQERIQAAHSYERQARENASLNRRALDLAQEKVAAAESEIARRDARKTALSEALARQNQELVEAELLLTQAIQEFDDLPSGDELDEARASAQASAEKARADAADARAASEALARQKDGKSRRRATLLRECQSWQQRLDGASAHLAAIQSRREEAALERDALEGKPEDIALTRRRLLDDLHGYEQAARHAADQLSTGESRRAQSENAARDALRLLGEARENLARLEARREAADQKLKEVRARLDEALNEHPDSIAPADDFPDSAAIARALERLKGERERLGAVNLRADEELEEVQQSHDSLHAEQIDLTDAIATLRKGLNTLNKEGRERLSAAFERVNGHFIRLFSSLFGGGEAHLQLIEDEDPLNVGLEVVARPPGKKPQTLSLLSGGEQALTAMALIFAIFLTNPAPICVLDEVDAPLDDANVERFCDLLDNMSRDTDTRFLVITHNPVTMSRMDRLFGVTMAERGVSQLVSVDLQQAEQLLDVI